MLVMLIGIIHIEVCKDDQQSQWEMPYFGVCQQQNPWVDFQKILHG